MEIKRELNVNRHELYELIINSALEDIRKYKPNTTAKDLHSGFYYEKNLNGNVKKKANTVVTVKCVKKDEKYSVAFETLTGITTTSYELSDSSGKTLVTYKEEYKAKNGKSSLGIFGGLMESRGKKKLNKMFDQMERYLNKEKK